jgi:hypothetical protein
MSLPGTRAGRCRRGRARQSGQSLIATIAITSVVGLLLVASLSWARSSTSQATRTARGDVALQAAEAGVQLYLSRIVEDPRYWRNHVDLAEDPRINTTGGGTVQPGQPWAAGATWTYTGPTVTWRPLQDARFGNAAYSLRVTPAPGDSSAIMVQSTARVMPSGGGNPVVRSVQARVSPLSIADFQMISNQSISYGSAATTTGKLYSAGNIVHAGTATAPLYAANLICRSGSGQNCSGSQAGNTAFQAGAFDRTTTPSFRQKFPTPIDFSSFTQDLADVRAAAQATGVYRTATDATGWMVQFLATGQMRIWKITGSTSDLGATIPRLECPETVTLPGGSQPVYVYFEQSVVIGNGNSLTDRCNATSGARTSVVDGQVTLASRNNVYIGNDIRYEGDTDDVLGLIAAGEVIIGEYSGRDLNWRAATLAQNGQWRTNKGTTDRGTMTFTGSTATSDGGYASMFATRVYNYDPTLQSLRPPLFPTIEGSWQVAYWREVTPP